MEYNSLYQANASEFNEVINIMGSLIIKPDGVIIAMIKPNGSGEYFLEPFLMARRRKIERLR